jgi:tetratricopeptide (TPR) repeat protein
MQKLILAVLVLTTLGTAQDTTLQDAEIVKALDTSAKGNNGEAIDSLVRMVNSKPSEGAFFYLGSLYVQQKEWARAAATFEDGAAKYPLSVRLNNAAAKAYEQLFNIPKALQAYRRANLLDPSIAYTGGGRFEPEYNAIYMPIVHDHRGANACAGRLYAGDDKMHFVVYMVFSGWGPGNDDSFEVPYAQIDAVEVDRKKGELAYDYSLTTLLTNLSGPRRRLASGEDSRIDLKFTFKQPINGYRGKAWTKSDIKFFFVEPETGEKMVKYLESKGVKITNR